jgi:hypothetical protein
MPVKHVIPLPTSITRFREGDLTGAWLVQPMYPGVRATAVLARGGKMPRLGGNVYFARKDGPHFVPSQLVANKLQEINEKWTFREEDYVIDGMVHNDKFYAFDGAFLSEWRKPRMSYEWRNEIPGTFFRLQTVDTYKTFMPNKGGMQSTADGFFARGFAGAIYRRPYERVKRSRNKLMVKVVANPHPIV